jgi:hypothetical protein
MKQILTKNAGMVNGMKDSSILSLKMGSFKNFMMENIVIWVLLMSLVLL